MKLKHPVSKQTIETDAEHAAMYESQGWEPIRAAASKKSDA